jgi:hypothetical protein
VLSYGLSEVFRLYPLERGASSADQIEDKNDQRDHQQ